MSARDGRRAGAALITSLMVIMVLSGLAITYLTLSAGGRESGERELSGVRARLAADEGIHLAVAELKSGVDGGGDGLGVIAFTGGDERQVSAVVEDLGGGLFRIRGEGRVPRAAIAAEVIAEVLPSEPLGLALRGAIVAEGPVTTLGNINVDGRDYDYSGTTVVGPGVFGISTVGLYTNGGSSTVGGIGAAPSHPPPPGVVEAGADWSDGVDNDGDGAVDEESYDGQDNDSDGRIDEDTGDYPQSPDAALGQPPGTLALMAQTAGTYFATVSEFDAYKAANGGSVPGGAIVYLAFDTWLPADFGSGMNDPPSILVHHNSTGTALMKNLHGQFRGLVLADRITHINGDYLLVGGLMSFADEAYGNAFGNGAADVLYSSTVLGMLPAGPGGTKARILAWSRASTN